MGKISGTAHSLYLPQAAVLFILMHITATPPTDP